MNNKIILSSFMVITLLIISMLSIFTFAAGEYEPNDFSVSLKAAGKLTMPAGQNKLNMGFGVLTYPDEITIDDLEDYFEVTVNYDCTDEDGDPNRGGDTLSISQDSATRHYMNAYWTPPEDYCQWISLSVNIDEDYIPEFGNRLIKSAVYSWQKEGADTKIPEKLVTVEVSPKEGTKIKSAHTLQFFLTSNYDFSKNKIQGQLDYDCTLTDGTTVEETLPTAAQLVSKSSPVTYGVTTYLATYEIKFAQKDAQSCTVKATLRDDAAEKVLFAPGGAPGYSQGFQWTLGDAATAAQASSSVIIFKRTVPAPEIGYRQTTTKRTDATAVKTQAGVNNFSIQGTKDVKKLKLIIDGEETISDHTKLSIAFNLLHDAKITIFVEGLDSAGKTIPGAWANFNITTDPLEIVYRNAEEICNKADKHSIKSRIPQAVANNDEVVNQEVINQVYQEVGWDPKTGEAASHAFDKQAEEYAKQVGFNWDEAVASDEARGSESSFCGDISGKSEQVQEINQEIKTNYDELKALKGSGNVDSMIELMATLTELRTSRELSIGRSGDDDTEEDE